MALKKMLYFFALQQHMTSSFSNSKRGTPPPLFASVVKWHAPYFVLRIGAYDPKKYSAADIPRVAFLNNDALLMDEDNQVHGFVTILDFRQARVHSIESLLSRENKMHP